MRPYDVGIVTFFREEGCYGNGDFITPHAKGCQRFRVRLLHQPGAATGVMQVLSLLGLDIEELVLRRNPDMHDRADLHCLVSGAECRLKLVQRKLLALLQVLEVESCAGCDQVAAVSETTMPMA